MSYLTRIGTVLSQAANALVFNGHPDMSLSSRAYLEQDHWFWGLVRSIADTLFGAEHCKDSWASDVRYANDINHLEAQQ